MRYVVRLGETPATATALLRAIHGMSACEIWFDSLSYADADLTHVRGHRQVTDAYLASLTATRPDSVLATLDVALVRDLPERTFLVPELV